MSDKKADLAGPGIGDYRELEKIQVLGEAGKTEREGRQGDRLGLIEAVMKAHKAVKRQSEK